MSWLVWILACIALAVVIAALLRRRHEVRAYASNLEARVQAKQKGSYTARLQHPSIDLSKCIGCGACIHACPEDGVLALAYGQAVVVHGARCVGHGLCASACPAGAIALTLGDLRDRRDLPAIDDQLEAVTVPGLFLAGEISGFALVRTAVSHGVMVAREVAARIAALPPAARAPAPAPRPAAVATAAAGGATATATATATTAPPRPQLLDLVVIGMGPAGLACALGAKERGLAFLCLEQATDIGGTVAAYPRKKLVMTQPMDLPLHGRLKELSYSKEELVELWQQLHKQHRLPVKTGIVVQGVQKDADGNFTVTTQKGKVRARHVCLALGRRGAPRKLDVPGEDHPKVSYSLLDAESYQDRQILVVGGGDSAIEAALALAEQPGNTVTLSYRKEAFFRLKARNEKRIGEAMATGTVQVLFHSDVTAITPETVQLKVTKPEPRDLELPNTEIFVFAGGTPPFPLLEAAGVSFDPALRPPEKLPDTDNGAGLLLALSATLAGTLVLLCLRIVLAGYYDLPPGERPASPWHDLLRPQGTIGLAAGLLAVGLFAVNLLYLLRRSHRFGRWLRGTLRGWMSVHVATGLGALLVACLHSSFQVRDTVGGHAFLAMLVVVAAGIVGRWFYAFVPRVQNGKQADLEELHAQVQKLSTEWDQHGRGFGGEVRNQVEQLVAAENFGRGFFHRVVGLLKSQWHMRARMRELRAMGEAEGVPLPEITRILLLAHRAHRLALQLTHFEEVRGILATWRWIHRWLALLLLLLTAVHVVFALRFGGVDLGVFRGVGR